MSNHFITWEYWKTLKEKAEILDQVLADLNLRSVSQCGPIVGLRVTPAVYDHLCKLAGITENPLNSGFYGGTINFNNPVPAPDHPPNACETLR